MQSPHAHFGSSFIFHLCSKCPHLPRPPSLLGLGRSILISVARILSNFVCRVIISLYIYHRPRPRFAPFPHNINRCLYLVPAISLFLVFNRRYSCPLVVTMLVNKICTSKQLINFTIYIVSDYQGLTV